MKALGKNILKKKAIANSSQLIKMEQDKKFMTFLPVIFNCNDNCISCPVPRRTGNPNPSIKEIKKKIDEILSFSDHIEINGGEPTIRNDLPKILEYIESKNAKEISLLTNTRRFCYNNYAKKIAKTKNLKIITTLYGHDALLHNSITRTPKSFEQKIDGIKNLISYNVPIELRILIHKMNYKHLDSIANFIIENFQKENFEKIIIMNPRLTNTAKNHEHIVSEKITVLASVLEKPFLKLKEKGFKVGFFHFPHCVLSKQIQEFSHGATAGKPSVVFAEKCSKCSKKEKCSGIWKSYLEIFGEEEFNPI